MSTTMIAGVEGYKSDFFFFKKINIEEKLKTYDRNQLPYNILLLQNGDDHLKLLVCVTSQPEGILQNVIILHSLLHRNVNILQNRNVCKCAKYQPRNHRQKKKDILVVVYSCLHLWIRASAVASVLLC